VRWILTTALVGVCVAAFPAQGAHHGASRAMTIRLISVNTDFRVLVDRAPKQELSKGDVLWAKSVLRNDVPQFGRPKGARVGGDTGTLTLVSAKLTDVKVAAKLPGGTLMASGRIPWEQGGSDLIPVVGGTGDFAGARGTVEAIDLDDGLRTRNIYRLRLP
jgi:hypothetical protein